MTNWKPGMKAVCVLDAWYKYLGVRGVGPAKNETVEVKDTWVRSHPTKPGTVLMLRLVGWSESYSANGFRPLLGDEQEHLDAIEEEVGQQEVIAEPQRA